VPKYQPPRVRHSARKARREAAVAADLAARIEAQARATLIRQELREAQAKRKAEPWRGGSGGQRPQPTRFPHLPTGPATGHTR
jgi:hypothetical protein